MPEKPQAHALTLFAVPKPFTGHIGVIQRNAVGSWRRLGEQVQIKVLSALASAWGFWRDLPQLFKPLENTSKLQ